MSLRSTVRSATERALIARRVIAPHSLSCRNLTISSSSARFTTSTTDTPLRSSRYISLGQAPTHLAVRLTIRHYSTEITKKALPPAQQVSYDRLRPVIDTFEAPIDWAVAYGSGVMKQAKRKEGDPPPLTDFLLSTPSAVDFHTTNLKQNPSHYPLYARLMGGERIAWAQESYGAGVWYVTMVNVNGLDVKYGVISSATLQRDLEEWTTFYLSGRLHKPVLPLLLSPTAPSLSSALESNLHSALCVALILSPPEFTEDELWERIAGLSYSGDPRMSVPGAENPDKVKNIVKGDGAREGFRAMYGPFLTDLGLSWEIQEEKSDVDAEWVWKGEGEEVIVQPDTPQHAASLATHMPINLKQAVARHYAPLHNNLGTAREAANWFEPVQDWTYTSAVSEELRRIIGRPALRQSIKGLFTAGPVKSFYYSLAKVRKWLSGRKQILPPSQKL
ncbi:hypothetical protein CI109_106010 [Kwoniella shandongensis]|uniref:Phosphatidate cytidylyltransferase, mitochondrial n=1 Tax=Kwoniella shandongensis TaxID=1734106 RepID=A0A5M6C106_9TREE|nr:uncharacterized protein CI109_003941 [Kwoniella shandongensis]KAA5527682.1 hypothetical protein CI109_003941 [Kwoniella shandongensis]